MKSFFYSAIFLLISSLLSACSGGTKSSGVFAPGTSCTTPSCSTAVTSAVRITNDSTSLSKTSDVQVQIGGVCNPGDNAYNEIHFTMKRTQQTCVAALTETSLDAYGYGSCESGRFYYVIPLTPVRLLGGGCTANTNVQYTVTAQIYYGASSANLTAGPKYSSDITIQH